jgi:hypothetical protein
LLAGADVGALAVLDVLFRHPSLARGAVLIDPPLFQFVPEATEALSEERAVLDEALRGGGGAVAAVRALKGVDLSPRDARAFFADYGAVATLEISRGQLRAIAVPLAVVVSDGAPAHVRAAAEALRSVVPAAQEHATWQDAVRALA